MFQRLQFAIFLFIPQLAVSRWRFTAVSNSCKKLYQRLKIFFFCHSRFLSYGFYGTFRSAVFQFQFLCLSFLQVVGRSSGALSSATHAHSTSHSQTYVHNNIYTSMGALPDGTRTRADLAVLVERVLILPSTPYRQPRGDIHTHPWPGGGFSLGKILPLR
jgi:hypothetical protein